MTYGYFVDFRYICGIRHHQCAVRRDGDGIVTGDSGDVKKHDPV